MEAIKFYTLDEVKDKHIGEVSHRTGISMKLNCNHF